MSYLQIFIAKTETISNPIPRSFPLKSLLDFAGDLSEDLLFCPVRAIKLYLNKTSNIVNRPGNLFVSPRNPLRPISKNAISFFIREVISKAGASLDNESSLRAHSVRGVSTSAAFLKNCSISKVLEAASWRSNSVFSLFYFKDMTMSLDGCNSLGPFVSAGAVVS